MKFFIIISTLIINSVFGQIVIEQIISNDESIGFYFDHSYAQKIIPNYDYNGDGSNEIIITSGGSAQMSHIFDLKNSEIIESYQSIENGNRYELVTMENITCEDCMNGIFRRSWDSENVGLVLIDFENHESTDDYIQLGYEENLFTISDVDGDGLKEIVIDNTDNGNIEIWGNGTTTTSTTTSINPSSFKLNQNYPNPFNQITSISYQVQSSGDVVLNIYDVLGNKIKTLVNESKPVGDYQIKWDGTNQNGERLSSGQYFYQLQVGDFVSTKKMVLLK